MAFAFSALLFIVPYFPNPLVVGHASPTSFLFTTETQFYQNTSAAAVVTYSLVSGAIPGMTFGAGGFTGTPSAAGTFTFTVQLNYTWQTFTNWIPGNLIVEGGHVQQCITGGAGSHSAITWNNAGGTTADGAAVWQDMGLAPALPQSTFQVTVYPTAQTVSFGFNDGATNFIGIAGVPFGNALLAFNTSISTETYTLTGTLPAGLSITQYLQVPGDPAFGFIYLLTGTVTTPGTYQFAMTATGSLGHNITAIFTLCFAPVQTSNILWPICLPPVQSASPWSFQLSQTFPIGPMTHIENPPLNGTGPYTFAAGDNFPAATTISSAGLIAGTAQTVAPDTFTSVNDVGAQTTSSTGHTIALGFAPSFYFLVLGPVSGAAAIAGTEVGIFSAGNVGGGNW